MKAVFIDLSLHIDTFSFLIALYRSLKMFSHFNRRLKTGLLELSLSWFCTTKKSLKFGAA